MNTIVIDIDEAAHNLADVARRLRECGDCALLMDASGLVAEMRPFSPAAVTAADGLTATAESEEEAGERTGPRVVYSKLTGLPVVTARPGARKVTSEEIYELLRGSFP